MNSSVIRIHYSPLLWLPLFKDISYLIQFFLLKYRLTSLIWISRKDTPLRKRLLSQAIRKNTIVFLSSWQLGYQLRFLNQKYVLALDEINVHRLSNRDLHDLKWSALFAHSVTKETQNLLKKIIPETTAVWKSYAVCVRDDLSIHCDFVKQTVKQLIKKRIHVVLISARKQSNKSELLTGKCEYIYLPELDSIPSIPFRIRRLVNPFYEAFQRKRLRTFFATYSTEVLWCFDPEDIFYVSLLTKNIEVIYDVVDHLSSEQETLRKNLDIKHNLLLKKATLVVANSHILLKKLKKRRKDVELVPQGFDIDSFLICEKSVYSTKYIAFSNILRSRRKTSLVVTYIGTLSFRVDYSILIQVIRTCKDSLFCLPDSVLEWKSEDEVVLWKEHIKQLKKMKNILWYPALKRHEVAHLLEKSSVGIIPYDLSFSLNKYCFPMKFFEYLYAGVKIISTPIPELKRYRKFCTLSPTAKSWITSLKKISQQEERSNEGKLLCEEHSWESKVNQVLKLLQKKRCSK